MYGGVKSVALSLSQDIDGDGIISQKDMSEMLDLLTDRKMDGNKKNQIIDGVMNCSYCCHLDGMMSQ